VLYYESGVGSNEEAMRGGKEGVAMAASGFLDDLRAAATTDLISNWMFFAIKVADSNADVFLLLAAVSTSKKSFRC
jgi:hypothetical protein